MRRPSSDRVQPESGSLSDHIEQNIENVVALQRRHLEQLSASQRRVEHLSRVVGRPAYLLGVLVFVAIWIAVDLEGAGAGRSAWFDPPPFPLLQGILTLVALLTTTIVLIAQNHQATLEQQRAHLDLQVNLLTEQKVTKLIDLIEELRRDLPMVRDREDRQAAAMQEAADTAQVLTALETGGLTSQGTHPEPMHADVVRTDPERAAKQPDH
jgi:uncharacterized membrane protein